MLFLQCGCSRPPLSFSKVIADMAHSIHTQLMPFLQCYSLGFKV